MRRRGRMASDLILNMHLALLASTQLTRRPPRPHRGACFGRNFHNSRMVPGSGVWSSGMIHRELLHPPAVLLLHASHSLALCLVASGIFPPC